MKPLNCGYTAIFSVLGFPVTQVPLGLGSWGVPLGLQVIVLFKNVFTFIETSFLFWRI